MSLRAAAAAVTWRERRRVDLPEAAVVAGSRALDAAAEARWAVTDRRVSRALGGLTGFVVAAIVAAALSASPAAAPHVPALLLVAVAAVAGARGRRAGAVAGFATGLAADMFVATPLGLGAFVFTLVGSGLGGSLVSPLDPARRRAARARAVAGAVAGTLLLAAAGRLFGPGPAPADTLREAAAGAFLAFVAAPAAFAAAHSRSRR